MALQIYVKNNVKEVGLLKFVYFMNQQVRYILK